MPLKPRFALVRWVEEESVGVMPLSAVKKNSNIFVGAIVEMKFKKAFYDAEVLKISGKLKGKGCLSSFGSWGGVYPLCPFLY